MAYPSVLVLGAAPSLTWSVARCLRRAGRAPMVLRWGGRQHSSTALEAAALAHVRQVCDSAHIETVLAADGDTALLLAQATIGDSIPACTVPSAATIVTLRDKWNFTRLLGALGLPAPDSMRADDAEQLLANPLLYPVVTRPLERGSRPVCQVHRSREALERRMPARFPLIAQTYVPGWDVGASFLVQHGRLAACSVFRHTRRGERTFYPSVRVREYVECLVAACGYSGVGHIDLRYDPSRDSYFLLELRPCFCASLLYAERAGLNYPDLLLKLDGAARGAVAIPRPGRVRLPLYERAVMLAARVGSG